MSKELLGKATPRHRHFINETLTKIVADNVVKSGDSVFDVGANAGWHTRNLSRLVGADGIVHAFEPNPLHWSALLEVSSVRLWSCAVGDRISAETFYFAIGHDEAASLHDPRDWIGSNVDMRYLTVLQADIDSLEEACRKPVSFIKMDVERNEFKALLGARNLIERDHPVVILEGDSSKITGLMNPMGYQRYPLGGQMGEMPNALYIPLSFDPESISPSEEAIDTTIRQAFERFPL
ncbi:FkbM family methyltransferase [Rhizobium sp. AB2/73]|uniref:FkbM family methyltransferase n=1 Tax=Rhizobium sp. AB2/73 TaxID=2795216 RepID=UPI001C5D6CA4|nr:FkbM family methyltransferase [Rhizobium sp. AB2/73]QYA13666.1 FkbM family methyltransferase [Rhizobium sp. AB2/73]UEQ80404.1 FkbM family methyltransferase [Rhizobium sp. AB2/73]